MWRKVVEALEHFHELRGPRCRGGESSAWTAAEEKLFLEGLKLYGM